jgi:hypothetical protein
MNLSSKRNIKKSKIEPYERQVNIVNFRDFIENIRLNKNKNTEKI